MSEFPSNNRRPFRPSPDSTKSAADPATVIRVLWETTRELGSVETADAALTLVARAIARAGLYDRAVLTLHNEQGDITAIGSHGVPEEVIAAARRASRVSAETRKAILDPANKISASYFIPAELGIDLTGEGRFVGDKQPPSPEGQWQPEDQLFAPLRDPAGTVIGYASVDSPVDNRRPDLITVRHLELLVHLAENALERLQAREHTADTESRLQRLMSGTEDVIFRADLTTDSIEYINAAIEKLTGYPAEYFLSVPFSKVQNHFIHPDDRKVLWPYWPGKKQSKRGIQAARLGIEFRLRHKNGEYRRVWEKRTIIYDDDGRVVGVEGILRDITDRARLQQELAESERKYRHLADNTRDLVYVRDTAGNLSYLSPSAGRHLGVAPEAALNENFTTWLTGNPINQAAFEVSNAAIIQGQTVPPFVLEMRSGTGRVFLMEFSESPVWDDHGDVVGVQGVGRDVTEHRRAEEALEKSLRKFRELADLLPQTVFEVDLDGNLTFANQSGLITFGYSREDLARSFRVLQLFIPEDAGRIKQNKQQILETGFSPGHEYTAVRKDGSTFPVMVYSSPISQDEEFVGLRGIVLDLTNQKLAEKALREEETRYRGLFENSPISMWEEDWSQVKERIDHLVSTGVTDLGAYFDEHPHELSFCWSLIKVINVNKAAIDRFGAQSKEELLAAHNEITTDESLGVFGETIDALRKGITTFVTENSILRLDGQIVYSDARVSVVPGHEDGWSRIIVSVVDVTERKRVEQQLRNQHDVLQSLLETANGLIFCLDSQSRITVFNKELEKVTGYTRDEVIGKSWPDMFLPRDHYHHQIKDFAAWVRQYPRGTHEGPLITKSGEVRTILWSNSALFFDDSDEIMAICVGQDITDRKQIEQALQQSERRFQELFHSVMEGIAVVDEKQVIQYCNPALAEIFGEDSPANFIGKCLLDYIPLQQHALFEAEVEKRRQGIESRYELDIITARNEKKTILASVSPRLDSTGTYIGAFGAVLDITLRKQAEKALAQSEAGLRKAQQLTHVGNWEWCTKNHVVKLSEEMYRILGVPENNQYRSLVELIDVIIHPDDRGRVFEAWEKFTLAEELAPDITCRIVRPDGETRWIVATRPEVRYTGQGPGEDVLVGTIQDITEHREAEEALRRSEAQFRTFAENIPGVVCIYDEYPDGRRESVYIGPGLEKLVGEATKKQVGGNIDRFMELIVPEDQEQLQKAAEEAASVGGILDHEYRVRTGAEDYHWVRVIFRASRRENGAVRWEGQGFDVTDRKEALEALRTSEETARALLDATDDAVLLIKPDGTIVAANDTLADKLGVEPDRLIGASVYDTMPPALAKTRETYAKNVAQTGQAVRYEDRQAGRIFDTIVYPLFDDTGKVERLAVFARDVTEREEMLQKLHQKGVELDKANAALEDVITALRCKHERSEELSEQYRTKNAELESLVSMLSHDLKTPLISIRELAGLFRRKYARLIDEGGQGMARRISSNATQMLRLVESLLDYSRVPDRLNDDDEVELGPLVDDIWEQVVDAFPGRKAVLRRPSQSETLRCSRVALERVLVNLLRNAVAYVPDDRRPKIEIGWRRSAGQMTITFADNGIGIPADEQDKIFELFYRTQPAAVQGSGVGLAVVKKIIDAIGGTITVSSQPGEGTVFSINLPVTPAQ